MSVARNGIFYAVFALTSCVSPALVVTMGPRVAMVVAGLAYGLGVGPPPFSLMSTLYSQNMKTTGITIGQVVRALVNTIQFKAECSTLIGPGPSRLCSDWLSYICQGTLLAFLVFHCVFMS